MMLKEHMGSSGNHFEPSSVTSTLPPRTARRPTTRFLKAPRGHGNQRLRPVLAGLGVRRLPRGQKALVPQLWQPRCAFPVWSVQTRILLQPAVPTLSLADARSCL
eukprot:6706010-Prymnesium_polylepis.2